MCSILQSFTGPTSLTVSRDDFVALGGDHTFLCTDIIQAAISVKMMCCEGSQAGFRFGELSGEFCQNQQFFRTKNRVEVIPHGKQHGNVTKEMSVGLNSPDAESSELIAFFFF